MLKLLLTSSIPLLMLTFAIATTQSPTFAAAETPSYEDAYVDPAFEKLERCEAATLKILFHETILTLHSSDYLIEATEVAQDCSDADFFIQPVQYDGESSVQIEKDAARVEELKLWLEALGVNASLEKPIIKKQASNFLINGGSVNLHIKPTRKGNS